MTDSVTENALRARFALSPNFIFVHPPAARSRFCSATLDIISISSRALPFVSPPPASPLIKELLPHAFRQMTNILSSSSPLDLGSFDASECSHHRQSTSTSTKRSRCFRGFSLDETRIRRDYSSKKRDQRDRRPIKTKKRVQLREDDAAPIRSREDPSKIDAEPLRITMRNKLVDHHNEVTMRQVYTLRVLESSRSTS